MLDSTVFSEVSDFCKVGGVSMDKSVIFVPEGDESRIIVLFDISVSESLFLLNSSFKFSEEIDENGVEWFRFYFNVVNYKEAKEINTYLNHILSPKPSSFN